MKFIKAGLLLAIVGASMLAMLNAKSEYTKKEGKPCTYCHRAGKFNELTDAGKYYKEHNHSLEGYKPAQENK